MNLDPYLIFGECLSKAGSSASCRQLQMAIDIMGQVSDASIKKINLPQNRSRLDFYSEVVSFHGLSPVQLPVFIFFNLG
jgi:hypothetical protein